MQMVRDLQQEMATMLLRVEGAEAARDAALLANRRPARNFDLAGGGAE